MTEELKKLDELTELESTPFPYRGHKDFRTFTQEDYDHWSGGLFMKEGGKECKWIGGKERLEKAIEKLKEMGYTVAVVPPHVSEIGNEGDGYQKVATRWYSVRFSLLKGCK